MASAPLAAVLSGPKASDDWTRRSRPTSSPLPISCRRDVDFEVLVIGRKSARDASDRDGAVL
jgi:hypothetical protein